MRAVWLLQRDLPVPPALLAEAKSSTAKGPRITPGDQQAMHPWSTYDNLVSTLCIAQHAAERAETGEMDAAMPTVGEGFLRGPDGAQEARAGLVQHLFEQRGRYLSNQLQRREAFLQHIPNANLATHIADRIDMERKGLQVYQLQQEVRRALVVSHVDVGVSLPCARASQGAGLIEPPLKLLCPARPPLMAEKKLWHAAAGCA